MSMSPRQTAIEIRVRYSETDQMGTFYNSRVLEWFECGRSEHMRAMGIPYASMEERGLRLPVVEAHVRYLGRARYDDRLTVITSARMAGRVRVRFENRIVHADTGAAVAEGYTVHAVADASGRPIRPPGWFVDLMGGPDGGETAPRSDSCETDR